METIKSKKELCNEIIDLKVKILNMTNKISKLTKIINEFKNPFKNSCLI